MGGKEKEGRVGGKGKGGERGEDVEGPGKLSAPGPVLALGGPGQCSPIFALLPIFPIHKMPKTYLPVTSLYSPGVTLQNASGYSML